MQIKNSAKRNVNNPQYFQGVLQLRNPTQEIINYIADEIEKKGGSVWIAKTKELKDEKGIDLYLSSNQFLKEIGKKLKDKFGGELKETARLFSRDSFTSRDVFRGCSMFRYVRFKKGDIVIYRGEKIQIISVANDIFGKKLSNNEKIHLKFSQLSDLSASTDSQD